MPQAPDPHDHEAQTETPPVQKAESLTLGYLSCPQASDGAVAGALLITDSGTRPLHFAYVAPIRPTTMQKILYGHTLNEHTKVLVIAKKLFTEKPSVKPDVLFVDANDLIDVRKHTRVPVAFLRKGEKDASSLSELVYITDGSDQDASTVGRIVASLEDSVDLLDPFDRLKEALKEALKGEEH